MRIIAGNLGGRQFEAPRGQRTHPMSERVRGGLFAALGDISGLSVLDGFAGSGALSLEAISRGASLAVAIDIDKQAHNTLIKNISSLKLARQIKAIRANASGWSDNNPTSQFDLVFVAPPYDDLQIKLIQKLVKHTKTDGLYVLDWPGNKEAPEPIGLKQIKQLDYGDAKVVFYRKVS